MQKKITPEQKEVPLMCIHKAREIWEYVDTAPATTDQIIELAKMIQSQLLIDELKNIEYRLKQIVQLNQTKIR